MKLVRLRIENFRNLQSVDIPLASGTVIVGENGSGKSNLLFALRLVLDASLSTLQRTLTLEDFPEALGLNPMQDGAIVRISVDLEDFDSDPGILAALHSALLTGDPMRARLTYLYRPRPGTEGSDPPIYEWTIVGGDSDDRRVSGDLRSYLHHVHLHALRDVESDLGSWRRSPLRPVLDAVARGASNVDISVVKLAMDTANEAVRDLQGVKDAASLIGEQTSNLVGALHRIEPTLDLAPADPLRTLRSLRLFLDGSAQRSISSGSLGSLNVLYTALVQIELLRRLANHEIEHALVSIEEPEAHLHPHLQRRMFAGLLGSEDGRRSTIVTTHSPHIVSVAPARNLVILRQDEGNNTTAAAAVNADLSESEWNDLSRDLDVTRSELVFARRVLLVEGFAEQVLMSKLVEDNFDENGVSVCAIHGTHFLSYMKFLRAMGTPYVVVTDGDPAAGTGKTGPERAQSLATRLGVTTADDANVFIGSQTFEADLFDRSPKNAENMIRALCSFQPSEAKRTKLEGELVTASLDGTGFLKHIKHAKGRFAQRLSDVGDGLESPDYVQQALERLMA